MNNLETIFVFDLDDTLVETTTANNMAYIEAYRLATGKKLSWYGGGRITREYFERQNYELSHKIANIKEIIFPKYLNKTCLLPCASILTKLKCERKVLLSNSRRIRGEQICQYYELAGEFEKMLFKEDYVGKRKYEFLVSHVLLKTEGIIVFENYESDVRDAIASGIPIKNIFIQK